MPTTDRRDSGRTVRLSQFLELYSRWLGSADQDELAHRIRSTVGLLLETDAVALSVSDGTKPVAQPPPGDALASRRASLERKALASMTPQLQALADSSHGAFPFVAGADVRGCLHVTVPRPLFEGAEVIFLRFVAWLAGLVIASAAPANASQNGDSGREPQAAAETDARRYVAMAVHDLRNPLNVISGYGGLLADGTLGQLAPEQSEAVEALNRQVAVLLGIIEQLIDFDRLSRAETSLSPSVIQLRAFFDELRERCFASTPAHVSWPGAEAGFEFTTDRRRLFAIVQNLVDNALKHGGSTEVTVACTRRDGRLIVSVADRGPGIPAAVRSALTDRDACDRLRERGNGLGLFTVACYVRALGGRLDVRAPESGGALLELTLPPLPAQHDELSA